MAGLRKCLCEECASLYVLNLRGDQRTSGEISRREGGKLFGGGSRTPIAITILVKNPDKAERGQIHYHDIGDYLTREDKLEKLKAFAEGKSKFEWQQIRPDEHGDWINQRDPTFDQHIVLGEKKNKGGEVIFRQYSTGLVTARDAWCYNASRETLECNVRESLAFYNSEVARYAASEMTTKVGDFINADTTQFSWTRATKRRLQNFQQLSFAEDSTRPCIYRPFSRQWAYFNQEYNEAIGQLPHLFPDEIHRNRVICISSKGAKTFSVLMVGALPDFNLLMAGAQCFPKYTYAEIPSSKIERLPNITESALSLFQKAYPDLSVDGYLLFNYIYGLLHSPDYRQRFGKNLLKQLPRIPLVASSDDFLALAAAGRVLGDLHVNYEKAEPYPALINGKPMSECDLTDEDYRVEKMRFAGKRGSDRSTIIYNHRITVSGIPDEAYDYSVNGRTPVEWIIDRQRVSTHKASGIVNDANRYAVETVGDPAYPLKLLLQAITVGIETASIVKGLPALSLREV